MEDPPITPEMVTRWAGIIEIPTYEEFQLFDTVNLDGEGPAPELPENK